MDNLDEMLQSAGLNPNDFHTSNSPTFTATSDPHVIQRTISQPNTVYATIEEDNPEPVSIPVPSTAVAVTTVEEAIAEEVTESPTTDTFTEEDWDTILNDVGFHSDNTAQETQGILEPVFSEESSSGNGEEEEEVVNTDESEDEDGTEIAPVSEQIPLNSPTLLVDESTSRFSGTEWYNEIQKANIIIAGCGGIGSWVCFQIARMHPASLYLYDDDTVELANMSGQLFSRDDVGKFKVSAIASMISKYTNMANAFAINKKFTPQTEAGDIMICGFDSMAARKIFFNSWARHVSTKSEEDKKKCLYLDGKIKC